MDLFGYWQKGIDAYMEGHFDIAETNFKISSFDRALSCDDCLSIAENEKGVCFFMLGKYQNAIETWEKALKTLAHGDFVDYTSLHLPFLLCKSEVTINIAITFYYLNQLNEAHNSLQEASKFPTVKDDIQSYFKSIENGDDIYPCGIDDRILFLPPRIPQSLMMAIDQFRLTPNSPSKKILESSGPSRNASMSVASSIQRKNYIVPPAAPILNKPAQDGVISTGKSSEGFNPTPLQPSKPLQNIPSLPPFPSTNTMNTQPTKGPSSILNPVPRSGFMRQPSASVSVGSSRPFNQRLSSIPYDSKTDVNANSDVKSSSIQQVKPLSIASAFNSNSTPGPVSPASRFKPQQYSSSSTYQSPNVKNPAPAAEIYNLPLNQKDDHTIKVLVEYNTRKKKLDQAFTSIRQLTDAILDCMEIKRGTVNLEYFDDDFRTFVDLDVNGQIDALPKLLKVMIVDK